MTTQEIMNLALKLAEIEKTPEDSVITVPCDQVQRVLIGVDMEVPELMLAKEMAYDLVISHHPKADTGVVDFHKVMDIQIDKMVSQGVPINKAQKVLSKKKNTVDIGSHVANYDRVSSAARLMNMPYMNIHLPADIIGEKMIQKHLDSRLENQPKATLKDVIAVINELDVYQGALAAPLIRCGSESSYAGRVLALFAGGTNGGADVYKAYFEAGVGTIVAMHCPEDVLKAVREQNIGNVIVAGHMASDSLGLNAIIKAMEEKGLEVTKMSGIL